MATIPGSHFTVMAGLPVNIVETTTGTGLPAAVPGDFNLEVLVGSPTPTPPLAPGYQGLAVLTAGGSQLDLLAGAYAVVDNGTGTDTLSAFGANETVIGGAANVTLNLFGSNEVAIGGGQDTIGVYGTSDTVNGGGNDLINDYGISDTVNGGAGNDTVNVYGSYDTFNVGTGADTINVIGAFDTVGAGAGAMGTLINVAGSYATTIADGPSTYHDTVVGFSQVSGDTIKLAGSDTASYAVAHATPQNGGADTLVTLNDGSTILLKGVTHIDTSFFS